MFVLVAMAALGAAGWMVVSETQGGPVTSVEASVAEKPRPRAYGQGLRYVLILYVKDSSSGRQARVPAENYGVATVGQAYTWNCYETPLFKRWRCAMAPGSPP